MEQPKFVDAEPQEIAAAVTVQSQVAGGRTIVLQTYIPRDAPIADYHATLDKLVRSIDRQDDKARLETLELELVKHKETLGQIDTDYKRISIEAEAKWQQQNRKGPAKLQPGEAAQKANVEQNIKRYRQEIAKIEADIEKCKASIARSD